ncbi:unnamed protein product, partial [Didymodactylos carnosus]
MSKATIPSLTTFATQPSTQIRKSSRQDALYFLLKIASDEYKSVPQSDCLVDDETGLVPYKNKNNLKFIETGTKKKCDRKKKKLLNMSSTFIYDGNDSLKENVEQQQQQQQKLKDQPSSRHDLPLLEPPSSDPSQQQTRVLNRPVPLRNSSLISQVLPTSPHPPQHMSTPSLSSQISSSNFAPLAASSQHNFTSIQRPSNSQGVSVRKRPAPSNQTTSSTSQPTAKHTKVYENEQVKEN